MDINENAPEAEAKKSDPDITVILVEPKTEGNVGAVARAMSNFGLESLFLVNPCELGDVAEKRAMHAIPLMHGSQRFSSFKEAIADLDLVIGTSGIKSENDKHFNRLPLTPREVAERLNEVEGRIGLAFGREDFGLLIDELELCDMFISIPTDPRYPIMNLSHAVAIVLYELTGSERSHAEPRQAADNEKELLYSHFGLFLDEIEYSPHKKKKAEVMFRRLMGRALPSAWEYHTLMGVFSKARTSFRRRGQ